MPTQSTQRASGPAARRRKAATPPAGGPYGCAAPNRAGAIGALELLWDYATCFRETFPTEGIQEAARSLGLGWRYREGDRVRLLAATHEVLLHADNGPRVMDLAPESFGPVPAGSEGGVCDTHGFGPESVRAEFQVCFHWKHADGTARWAFVRCHEDDVEPATPD